MCLCCFSESLKFPSSYFDFIEVKPCPPQCQSGPTPVLPLEDDCGSSRPVPRQLPYVVLVSPYSLFSSPPYPVYSFQRIGMFVGEEKRLCLLSLTGSRPQYGGLTESPFLTDHGGVIDQESFVARCTSVSETYRGRGKGVSGGCGER